MGTPPSNSPLRFALAMILIHLAVNVLHGTAHHMLAIPLTHAQGLFVGVVIVIAPLVAGLLLIVKLHRAAGALLAASMAGAFIFGVYYHFVEISPDHVAHLPAGGPDEWKIIFQTTAVLLALTEGLGCWAGVEALRWRFDKNFSS